MSTGLTMTRLLISLALLVSWCPVATPQDDSAAQPPPSTLTVEVYTPGSVLPTSTGTAFFLSPQLAVTCRHVVDGAARVVLRHPSGAPIVATSIAAEDESADISVLRVQFDPDASIRPLSLSFDSPSVNDPITIVSTPLGLYEDTKSTGVVTALRTRTIGIRRITEVQFDCAISPGSSGAPILNATGQVIGVVTSSDTRGQMINFGTSVAHIPLPDSMPDLPVLARGQPRLYGLSPERLIAQATEFYNLGFGHCALSAAESAATTALHTTAGHLAMMRGAARLSSSLQELAGQEVRELDPDSTTAIRCKQLKSDVGLIATRSLVALVSTHRSESSPLSELLNDYAAGSGTVQNILMPFAGAKKGNAPHYDFARVGRNFRLDGLSPSRLLALAEAGLLFIFIDSGRNTLNGIFLYEPKFDYDSKEPDLLTFKDYVHSEIFELGSRALSAALKIKPNNDRARALLVAYDSAKEQRRGALLRDEASKSRTLELWETLLSIDASSGELTALFAAITGRVQSLVLARHFGPEIERIRDKLELDSTRMLSKAGPSPEQACIMLSNGLDHGELSSLLERVSACNPLIPSLRTARGLALLGDYREYPWFHRGRPCPPPTEAELEQAEQDLRYALESQPDNTSLQIEIFFHLAGSPGMSPFQHPWHQIGENDRADQSLFDWIRSYRSRYLLGGRLWENLFKVNPEFALEPLWSGWNYASSRGETVALLDKSDAPDTIIDAYIKAFAAENWLLGHQLAGTDDYIGAARFCALMEGADVRERFKAKALRRSKLSATYRVRFRIEWPEDTSASAQITTEHIIGEDILIEVKLSSKGWRIDSIEDYASRGWMYEATRDEPDPEAWDRDHFFPLRMRLRGLIRSRESLPASSRELQELLVDHGSFPLISDCWGNELLLRVIDRGRDGSPVAVSLISRGKNGVDDSGSGDDIEVVELRF